MLRKMWCAVAIGSLAAGLSVPLQAQSRELSLSVHAGGLHGIADIDRNSVYSVKTGPSFGASLGVKVIDHLVVRGDFNYSKSKIRFFGDETGDDFNRLFGSLIAQIQFPTGALTPYILAGGGLVWLNQHVTLKPKQTRVQGVGGAGLAYRIGQSGLSIMGEGKVYVYQAKGLVGNGAEENHVMGDFAFLAGLSYAFGGK